mmetsp:Transcript_28024/g.60041  ORF Transcript_28024/g.60041 Transcript_28024/m.60041 type:complete len:378 (+) Transcript_28024:80-1213(+)
MNSGTSLTTVATPSTNQNDSVVAEKIEYNERWMGYLSIIMCSGINFICISIVDRRHDDQLGSEIGVAFGILTFLISSLVLLQDRSQRLLDYFHYTKARNGYIEGLVLVFMAGWWIVGVGVITKPGGIAYQASNIYYSSWGSLVSCLYTLNLWSTEKNILSVDEITGVSFTLKSWWVHFLSACVVFACSINLHVRISFLSSSNDAPKTPYAIVCGLVSIAVSSFWIGVHLNFCNMRGIKEGGWFEIFSTIFLMFMWIIGLSVFTKDGGIAAKAEGDECKSDLSVKDVEGNCTVILFVEDAEGIIRNIEMNCNELKGEVPGSNLYYSCWSCMLSAIAVAFRWKASQALIFAQAQAVRQQRNERDFGEGDVGEDNENASR